MEDGVFPTIYTEKKDGVQPEFDIRTDPDAVGIKAPDNPRKATKVYVYKVKQTIQIAYNMDVTGENLITIPDNQKIKLTQFQLKNIDDERTKILAAPSTSAYTVTI